MQLICLNFAIAYFCIHDGNQTKLILFSDSITTLFFKVITFIEFTKFYN